MFEVLARVVEADAGIAAWHAVLADTGLSGSYTTLGTYGDDELLALVGAIAARRGMSVDDTVRWFGRAALPVLVERYPAFSAGHTSARSFVLTLNHVIHPEVRKLYPGADVPDFVALDRPDGGLALEYRSPRALCTLAEGLILGAGDHFGEAISLSQSRCLHRGDEACVLELAFTAPTSA